MSENRWLILPIEVQRREMDAKLVIATIAASRGFKVLIGRDRIVRRLARFLPDGILIDKSIAGKTDGKPGRFHSLGHIVTAMDEEGTGFLADPKMFLDTRLAEVTLDVTARWFCISETVREKCIERYPDYIDRFVTTGLARTDTWRDPLLQMYRNDAEALVERFGRFILFNSNFGVPNHARGDAFVNKQIRKQAAMHSESTAYYKRMFDENRANWLEYVRVIPEILEWFPEHKIVVRPHPAENVTFWKEKFRDEPRVIVDDSGVVTPWILASEFMFHHACTTGVEAAIMKVPQVVYAPCPDIYHDTEMAKTFSPFVNSQEDFRKIMETSIKSGKPEKLSKKKQANYFASLEGKLASEKIVDELEKLGFESTPLPKWLPLLKYTPRHIASVFKDLTPKAKAYSTQKYHGVEVEELERKVAFNRAQLNLDAEFKIEKVFTDLFMISS